MMQKIEKYLGQSESEKLEFKQTFNEKVREKLFKTICAFANDFTDKEQSAIFLIGVNDTGQLSTYQNAKEDEEKIINWVMDWKVYPKPKIRIESFFEEENQVILIEVFPSSLPTWYDKKMYIRVGSSTREASSFELQQVLEHFKNISFDSSDAIQSDIRDIDEELFILYQKSFVSKEIIAKNSRSFLQKLSAVGFANVRSGYPTYGGLLVCGTHPQAYLPLAKVMFLSIDAEDLGDRAKIRNEKVLTGDLPKIVRELESLIEIHIKQEVERQGATLAKRFDYPFIAIRELVFNALIHRDYSLNDMIRIYWYNNRIEIKSPGGLHAPATQEDFPNNTAYRNSILASAMKNLGKVEQFGSGVAIAQKLLEQNSNPPAEFEFNEYFVKVTVRKA